MPHTKPDDLAATLWEVYQMTSQTRVYKGDPTWGWETVAVERLARIRKLAEVALKRHHKPLSEKLTRDALNIKETDNA